MLLGKQALDRVTETFQTDAQRVPRLGFLRPQSFCMKLFRAFESFQRQAFRSQTSRGNESAVLPECARKVFPQFRVEFLDSSQRLFAQLWLFGFKGCLQMCPNRIRLRPQLFYPLI